MDKAKPGSPRQFYLQDSRSTVGSCLLFWCPEGAGYTTDIDKSALFTEEEAFAQHSSRPSDIPWPAEYVQQRLKRVVDVQRLSQAPQPTALGELFYVHAGRCYDGNDLMLRTRDGSLSMDLADAAVYTRSAADKANGIPYAKAYLQRLARPVFHGKRQDLKEALGADFERIKRERPASATRFRCHGCGVFMSAVDYYTSPCKRCSTENRP